MGEGVTGVALGFASMFRSSQWSGLSCMWESRISQSMGAINVNHVDIHQVAHVRGFSNIYIGNMGSMCTELT